MVNPLSKIGRLFFDNRPKEAEVDVAGNWWYYYQIFGDIKNCPEKFSDEFAYKLALGLSEIFTPIDMIAERVASIPFVKKNEKGDIIEFTPSEKRLMEQPNIFSTGSQLRYSLVFSLFADGNSYLYSKMPPSYKTLSPDRISSLWSLRPDMVQICLNNYLPSLFSATKKSDLIDYYYYDVTGDKIQPDFICHSINMPFTVGGYANEIGWDCLKGKSPLITVSRNVNNLLAVYNARYNVYANNGIAGIITKKASGVNGSLEQAVNPVDRKKIADDLMEQHDIAGHNNIKAISSIPVEMVKTLATISELEPFRETFVDAVQIASTYGVKKELLPRESDTTYSNQKDAETYLWQNVVKGAAEDVGNMLTSAMGIIDARIMPVFDEVEALQEDRKTNLESDGVELDNLKKMQEMGMDVGDLLINMKNKYESQ